MDTRQFPLLTGVTALLVLLSAGNAASGAVREVGTGQTYTSIQSCLDVAVAGDTCNVHAGTYTEQLTLKSSGSSGNVITLRNNPGDNVRVQSSATPVLSINGKSYWTISGISIAYNGSGSSPKGINHTNGAGNVNYITVQGCTISIESGTGAGFGMYIASSDHLTVTGTTIAITATGGAHDGADFIYASNLQFTGNTIYGNASESTGKLEDGLVVSGTNLNIEDNILHDGWSYDTHPDGIVVQGDGDRNGNHTANVRIWRNTVYNFTQGIYFDAIHNPLDGANLIADNLIYETAIYRYGGAANKMNGIVIDGESLSTASWTVNANVYNNTIDAKQLHIYVLRTASGSSIDIQNNLLIAPPYSAVYLASTSGIQLDYNFYALGNTTPIKLGSVGYSLSSLRAASLGESHGASGSADLNANYVPTSTSAVIAKASNLSRIFTIDRAGVTRPATSAWDTGAFQFSSQVTSVPPTSLFSATIH